MYGEEEIIMNKTSKVCVAATLALGALIGVTVENSAPTSKQAQAEITPVYTSNGYIGNNANFPFWIRILLTRLSMIMLKSMVLN